MVDLITYYLQLQIQLTIELSRSVKLKLTLNYLQSNLIN